MLILFPVNSPYGSQDLSKVKVKSVSCVRLFATPWTVAYQVSLSIRFSRQEYCNELPFPSPGDLPNRGIKPGPCTAGAFFAVWATRDLLSRDCHEHLTHRTSLSSLHLCEAGVILCTLQMRTLCLREKGCLLRVNWSMEELGFRSSDGTPLQYPCLENPMDGGAW